MTMLEKVAQRLAYEDMRATKPAAAFGDAAPLLWKVLNEGRREYWRDLARAALEAMRDPPDEMCAEVLDHLRGQAVDGLNWVRLPYRSMIDAALKE